MDGIAASVRWLVLLTYSIQSRACSSPSDIQECDENISVNYSFTDGRHSWAENGIICIGDLTYRAVVGSTDEMCVLRKKFTKLVRPAVWIDFSPDISPQQFTTNGTFFGIPVKFANDPSKKCLLLRYNETCNDFEWGQDYCNESYSRACMNDSRKHWNQSETNNVLPESFGVRSPNTILEIAKLIEDCTKGTTINCDTGQLYQTKVAVRDKYNCSLPGSFEYFSVTCPSSSLDNTTILVSAEISARRAQLNRYLRDIRETNEYTEMEQRHRTLLLPPEDKVLSISFVKSTNKRDTFSRNVSFFFQLDYDTMFKENGYDLFFDSEDEGVLRSTYLYVNHEPVGVFLNEVTHQFDTVGVECSGNDWIECTSNHTTIFAVLLSVETIEIPRELKVLAIVTQSISVLFLFVTFVILVRVRKRVRGERIPIQINLSFSLLLLHFWLLFEDIALQYPAFCRAIAVLTHYLLLSSALWMMNEANLLLFRTSKWAALSTKRRKVVIFTMGLGWGVPALMVGITAAIGFSTQQYMEPNEFWVGNASTRKVPQYEHCLLNDSVGIRLSATIPVSIILTYNFVVAVWAVVFVHRKRSEGRKYRPSDQGGPNKMECLGNILHSLKVIFLLLPVLGIPWILILLSHFSPESLQLRFLYTNTLINGLQGVLIFFVYCVADTKVRDAVKKTLTSLSSVWSTISDSLDKRRKSHASHSGANAVVASTDVKCGRPRRLTSSSQTTKTS